jgi:hypothetical protein
MKSGKVVDVIFPAFFYPFMLHGSDGTVSCFGSFILGEMNHCIPE